MTPEIRAGIIETANALGMDPVTLATIISYETAGTFDPTKAGPTTQWGQHKGLIQFGEPQAQEYGVNWADPVGSQLGADGAVAKYFTQNGWQPGMGMMDAYSIVNAGAPGLYNASDANNGGAPGTVADKVNNQMDGHRDKALSLLGFGPNMPAATPQNTGILPLDMGTEVPTEASKWAGLLAAATDMAKQPQAQAPQLMPMQRQGYQPVKRDTITPLQQFFQTLR